MGAFSLKSGLVRFRSAWLVLAFVLIVLASFPLVSRAQPSISPPAWIYPNTQVTLSNCTNANTVYLVQMSTNLTDWTLLTNCYASPTNLPVLVPATNDFAFYRLITHSMVSPGFQYALVSKTNMFIKGNGCTIDSFDSSDPLYSTQGLYDITKRKANGNVATGNILRTSISVQNYYIYGHLMTGYGTVQTNVPIVSTNCAIGDLAWDASTNGIEPGYWTNNFLMSLPDVPAPTASAGLPPAGTNGVINLTSGAYLTTSDPGVEININGPVTLWVTTNYTPYITFNTNNPNASLVLFVGATTGPGIRLWLGSYGNMNYPGYAKNFQIYGLPTLNSVSFLGNPTIAVTIYAPEATVSGGGSGSSAQDVSGAIIANTINLNGHWSFHYDESLSQLSFPAFH